MEGRAPDHVSGDRIPSPEPPEPAHLREEHQPEDDTEEREATELQQPRPLRRNLSKKRPENHWYDPVNKFWRHNVRISVPHVDCRDHLANERTFLGYLRTSVAISMLGIVVEQLWQLQRSPHPNPVFGYYVLSRPLAAILQLTALGMVVLGSIRFFRQQSAMARGKIHAGGWEVFVVMVFMTALLLCLFALQLSLEIYKDSR